MSSASWALQAAIFTALAADSTVQSLLGVPARIYDAVPRDAPFPYAVIGDGKEIAYDTATDQGSEHQVTVAVWSRNGGHKEAKSIAEAIRFTLNGAVLSLSGHALVDLRALDTNFARGSDGETYSATLRLRAVTEPV